MKSISNKKNIILLFLLILFLNKTIFSYTGRTFFMSRPILQDIVLQKVTSYKFIKEFDDGGLKILGTPFYKQSDNARELAKYFFIDNKTDLTVQGPDVAGVPDISSTWLTIVNSDENLIRNFSSKIKIRPEQKTFGFNLQIFKNLNYLNKRIMFSASMPLTYIENNLKFNEYDISPVGVVLEKMPLDTQNHSVAANATEAFDHPLLFTSKMKNGIQKLAGVADIRLAVDLLFKMNNYVNLNIYAFGEIPTGFKPTCEYLFEPIVGNGKHIGLGGGGNFDLELWKDNNKKIVLFAGMEYEYLFEGKNKRVFDLKNNGQFNRYLDIRRNAGDGIFQATNLANITFLNSKITPRSVFNSFVDLCYSYKKINFKLGHNFWWRDSEKISLDENINSNYAITGLNIQPDGAFTLHGYYLNATIKDHASPSPNNAFMAITQDDLDLSSGRAPSAYSNKIYFNIGYDGKFVGNRFWLDAGIDYEFAGKNSALSNIGFLLQFGIAI
ncbi:MAG: hypothetical protein SZ59_C0002G0009 [candidate division TM6 bacterium GW2011_GWF2_28_16]|nr:MAG: hypothetical protein SZ59_C0002G0009 [candidate division TM6 bacterium GW2011_GWF2_28_16]